MKRDFLIGLFFLIALILFIGGILWIKGKDPFRREFVMGAKFSDAYGIEPGVYVYLRGVKVGEVRRVKITSDGVLVEFVLKKNIPLPEDSQVEAKSRGLFEGKILSLVPGISPKMVKKGDVLKGVRRDDITEILEEIDLRQIKEMLSAFRDFAQSGKELIEGSRELVENLSNRLEKIMSTAGPKISEASNELKELNSNLKDLVAIFKGGNIEKFLSDTIFYQRVNKTLDRLDSVLGKFQKEPVVRVKLF
ncbi:MAG: MlaD family protein [candidate division WOR-3 bacterium]